MTHDKWPTMTIVTPNYNTGTFIEKTILSVISQNYPNLEYILVDGGSVDNSLEVIEKYQKHFKKIIIEKDNGHADALNKGFLNTAGSIMGWINSDDTLLPGSLFLLAEIFNNFKYVQWMTGNTTLINENDIIVRSHESRPMSRIRFLLGDYKWIQQESTFWRRTLWNAAGESLNTDVKLAIDLELWIRFFRYADIYSVQGGVGAFRLRSGQRSETQLAEYENEAIKLLNNELQNNLSEQYRTFYGDILPYSVTPLAPNQRDKLPLKVMQQDLRPLRYDLNMKKYIDDNPESSRKTVRPFEWTKKSLNCTPVSIADESEKQGEKYASLTDIDSCLNQKVTIITASFNQAAFISRTLKSIESQSYNDIEHIIIDPGSTDSSLDIINDYLMSNPSALFIHEPDEGQTDAINKGLKRAKGEFIAWLNTDDFYLYSNAISDIVSIFTANPDVDVVYAKGHYIDEAGNYIKDAYINPDELNFKVSLSSSIGILQPALFFRKRLYKQVGGLDQVYNLSLDYEYWLRFAFANAKFKFFNKKLVAATLHSNSKTVEQRGRQYSEICQLMKQYYGVVRTVWLQRYADYIVNGSDGIVSSNMVLTPPLKREMDKLFKLYNPSPLSIYNAFKLSDETGSEIFDYWCNITNTLKKRVILTTSSDKYYNQLLTLISGLHHTSLNDIDLIVVYDLSLTDNQLKELLYLEKVIVLPYRRENLFEEYYDAKSYVYKCYAMAHWLKIIELDDTFLWFDAGVVPLHSVSELFDIAKREGVFFINHDDRSNSPLRNVSFTHPVALREIGASPLEALGEHVCSCLIGCFKGNRLSNLFFEAYGYSKNQQISYWPKHLSDEEHAVVNRKKNQYCEIRKLIELNPESEADNYSVLQLINIYPYHGHRQDQSIYSILASRYSTTILSAKRYCYSTDLSSITSKKNWESGGEWREVQKLTHIPEVARYALTYHHRGTYINHRNILTNQTKLTSQIDTNSLLFGPFSNHRNAWLDETNLVCALYRSGILSPSSNPVMLDVGALHGGSFRDFLNMGWQVHAFEPHPQVYDRLCTGFHAYIQTGQLTLNGCALSNKAAEEVPFYVSEESPGINSLTPFRNTHRLLGNVRVNTLRNYCHETNIRAVDFLKIDTEGYDLMVLQGMPWHSLKPGVILCEFENRKTANLGYTFKDMADFLLSKGYQVFVSEWHPIIRYGGGTHTWRQLSAYPCKLADDNAWGNLCAFQPAIDAAVLVQAVQVNMQFKAAKQIQPKSDTGGIPDLKELLTRFEHSKRSGNREDTLKLLYLIVEKYPDHLPSAVMLSNILMDTGDADRAMAIITRAIPYHPESKLLEKQRLRIIQRQ